MFDSLLGYPCSFRLASDGIVRCLPALDTIETLNTVGAIYADAACTQRLSYTQWPLYVHTMVYAKDTGKFHPLIAPYPLNAPMYTVTNGVCVPDGVNTGGATTICITDDGHLLSAHVASNVATAAP